MLAENVHFFIAYFLRKNSKFGIETSHTGETITGLLKNDEFVSNRLFMKQNSILINKLK